MSKVLVNETSLTAIGNAIRSKNGTDTLYKPSEMAAAIDDISVAGGDDALKALIERTLTRIEIPRGVPKVGAYAFAYCRNAQSITIPDSVTSIETYGFYTCDNVTELELPQSITTVGSYCFSCMYSLTSLVLPRGVVNIPPVMASENKSMTSFTAEGDLTGVAGYAFQNCINCIRYDFTACTKVPPLWGPGFQNINPDAKILVPAALCAEWKAATNWAEYADHIVGVGEGGSLDYLLNPDGTSYAVTGIGTYINTDGDGTKLVIPSEHNGLPVTVIETDAFGGNEEITSVSIPETVTSIGAAAFQDCSNITDIYFGAANMSDPEYGAGIFTHAGQSGDGIKVVIGNKVTRVPKNLFNGGFPGVGYSPKVVSVKFDGGSICTEIGEESFYYCESMTFIAPPTLTSIGSYALFTAGNNMVLDFSACTQIPTLADSTLSASVIYVPAALYDEWIVATNWSGNASKIVAK